jgi:putative DNA primase/helicase
MADFAVLGTAVEQTLGWPAGSFVQALDANQGSALVATLEDQPEFAPLLRLMGSHAVWEGTATDLLAVLATFTDEQVKRRKSWPATAAQLSIRLRRLAPAMRQLGIEFEDAPSGRDRDKRRGIRLTNTIAGDAGDSGDDSGQGRA